MKKVIYLMLCVLCIAIQSCSNDEPNTGSEEQNHKVRQTVVTNGEASGGVKYAKNDETTFFLDYIKYKIVDAHLEVVGYDDVQHFENVHIFGIVTIDGTRYETRVIASDGKHGAFEDMSDLNSIEIPSTIYTIGNSAFRDCTSLTSIAIPNSVTSIGEAAFLGCYGLTSITIPKSVTLIAEFAFENCINIKTIRIEATNPPRLETFFSSDVYREATLYVPKESLDKYKEGWGWGEFNNIVGF